MSLRGKVAVITGAAKGIGLACAKRFALERAKVVIADINDEAGRIEAEALRGTGHEDSWFQHCDVGNSAQVNELMDATLDKFGAIDVLVNNAAVLDTTEFLDIAEEDWDRIVRVNMKGYFLCAQAAARRIVQQGRGGVIINMSSVNAVVSIPNIAAYVACKGAVNQLTKTMALALAEYGIRVNGIAPGPIEDTEGMKRLLPPELKETMTKKIPLQRFGRIEDIEKAALFLCSDAASYISGVTLVVDGGHYLTGTGLG